MNAHSLLPRIWTLCCTAGLLVASTNARADIWMSHDFSPTQLREISQFFNYHSFRGQPTAEFQVVPINSTSQDARLSVDISLINRCTPTSFVLKEDASVGIYFRGIPSTRFLSLGPDQIQRSLGQRAMSGLPVLGQLAVGIAELLYSDHPNTFWFGTLNSSQRAGVLGSADLFEEIAVAVTENRPAAALALLNELRDLCDSEGNLANHSSGVTQSDNPRVSQASESNTHSPSENRAPSPRSSSSMSAI